MEDSISTAIVKPTDGFCNLACSYCYMQKVCTRGKIRVMSAHVLENLTDFFCSELEEIEFIWHGGEPLLAGVDFYQKVVQCQESWIASGKKIANFVQTNGVLLNGRWADFFSQNGFVVGVSLDGPARVHDATRRFKSGGSSLVATINGIEVARKAGIFNGVICCVSSHNCELAEETFDFLCSLGIKSIKFLRVKGEFEDSVNQGQYVRFLTAVLRRWLEVDDPEIEIRDIKSLIDIALGGNFRECVYMGRCDKFVTVYGDGSIYACDNLPKVDRFCFGNVVQTRKEVLLGPKLQNFLAMIDERKKSCSSCFWFETCRGGCAYRYLQEEKEENQCEDLKDLFGTVRDVLKRHQMV